MPSQWLQTQVENGLQTSSTATTQQTVTRDLPRSNFLGAVGGTLRAVGVALLTLSLDRVRVQANGGILLLDLPGGLLKATVKYDQSSMVNGVAVSTTGIAHPFLIQFGRFAKDEKVILPAKAFKSLQLQLQYTCTATTSVTSVSLDLWADELVSDDPVESKLMRRLFIVNTVAASANLLTRQKVPLGNFIRGWFLAIDDLDNLGGNGAEVNGALDTSNVVRVLVNGGAEIPYTIRATQMGSQMVHRYRFDDAAVPTGTGTNAAVFTGTDVVYKIDLDYLRDLAHAIDSARYNELAVEWTAAASATAGNVTLVQEEIVVVG